MFKPITAIALAVCLSPIATEAQGLLISQMECKTTYRNVPFEGVFQVQSFQYAGATGVGSAGQRSQLNILLKTGRAHEIPGTLALMGEFVGPGAIVHIEAPNIVGGQGAGGIVFNGMAHRATYATFALVAGGVVAVTEEGERIEYHCQE